MASGRNQDPTAYQRMFVVELRARRGIAGLSRNRLAQALGCSPQWIAKVETFEKPPSEAFADDLDTYFQSDGTFRRIWAQHVETRRSGLIPSGVRPPVEAEKSASLIKIYEPLLVTGLLQTEEYARFVISSGERANKTDELVAIRMERQVIFDRPEPPWFFLLIREAVIRRIRPEFRIAQCERLLEVTKDLEGVDSNYSSMRRRLPAGRVPVAQFRWGSRRGLRGRSRRPRADSHGASRCEWACRTLQRDRFVCATCGRFGETDP